MAESRVLASLRDAGAFGDSVPVVSSLCSSTTGYMLRRLRRRAIGVPVPVVSSRCSSTTGYML